ncbi:adenylate kinase [Borealophlyctis nickersoniae]|nr:adenylate kinase [Borealophlyctis nickersoniae]
MDDIISLLPPPRTVPVTTRACYILMGKPGCGKSTLGQKLATTLNLELIDPNALLTKAMQDKTAPTREQIASSLASGKLIPMETTQSMIHQAIDAEETAFKGYVFEALPFGLREHKVEEDMKMLEDLVANRRPNHSPVLINLNIDDESLIRRRSSQWVDPVTGIMYPGAQVTYSRKMRAEGQAGDSAEEGSGGEEGEEGEADEEGSADDEESDVDDDDKDSQEDEDEDDDDEKKKKRRKKSAKGKVEEIPLVNKTVWPILSAEIIDRLIKRPEDNSELVARQLRVFSQEQETLNRFRQKHFDALHVIDLDASQHVDTLFENAMERIASLGYSIHCKAVLPQVLNPPEGGFRGLAEQDIIKFLSTAQLEEGEPRRDLSLWGRYCPVTFIEEGKLVQAPTMNLPAAYRGMIYFLSSENYLAKFLANPDKYLCRPPHLSNLRICVLGGPFSGKTTQCKLLARIYRLKYVSVDEILQEWDEAPDQNELMKRIPLYGKLVRKTRSGKPIPPDMQVNIINMAIEESLKPEYKYEGWVLDGFPRTNEQVQALIGAEIVPQYVVVLQNDINDENVRSRFEIFKANSRTGRPFRGPTTQPPEEPDPTWLPDVEIKMYPHFDNLFNGFREEYADVIKTLEDAEATMITVQAELQIPSVLSSIQTAVDPFFPKAVSLTPKMQAELPPVLELGYTKDYCPFSLRDANILQKGNKQFSVKYEGQYYFCSSEEARAAFVIEPHNYVTGKIPMVAPPPRLMFLGPTASGKTTSIKLLEKWNIPYVRFQEYVTEFAERQEKGLRDEIEYMVRENAGLLSPPVLFEILQSLFKEEPYASRGFLMEGFPRTKLETEVLLKHNFHVDAFVVMKIEPEVAAHRRLPEHRKRAEEGYLARAAEEGQKGEAGGGRGKRKDDDDEDEEGGMPSDEDLMDELMEMTEKENSLVTEVTVTLDSLCSIPLLQIDANHCQRPVAASLRKALKPYLENRKSLFSSAMTVKPKEAEKQLQTGVKYYSRFGQYCPVAVKKTSCVTKTTCLGRVPVVYRDHIYFLQNKTNRDEFLQNTLEYVNQPSLPPTLPPTLFVLGRPKSGKTSLATQLAADMDVVYLTVASAVQILLEGQEPSPLHAKVKATLERGAALSDEIVTHVLKVVTSRAACQAKGWVLDGYPITPKQAAALEEAGVRAHLTVRLEISDQEMYARCAEDFRMDTIQETPRMNVKDVLWLRDDQDQKSLDAIKQLYQGKYASWVAIDGKRSKWSIKDSLKSTIVSAIARQQKYLDLKTKLHAAPIFDIGLSLPDLTSRLGKFRDYCPVSLVDREELVKGPEGTKYMAEYQNLYYRTAGPNELASFLSDPEKYVNGRDLPEHLPVRRSPGEVKAMFPKGLELQGYCPVTFAEGPKGFASIIPGDPECVAEYEDKLYSMATSETLEKFMRTPWKYTNLQLPRKLPPRHAPIPVTTLPLVGYLEQAVATSLIEALEAVGKARPKYPYKNVRESACQYLALYLKAHNSKSKEWVRDSYARRLKQFQERCDLIGALSDAVGANGGAYLEPPDRPPLLDQHMDMLMDLKPRKALHS